VDDVWDFSKLKRIERDDPADLKFWVSKLFGNISSTSTEIKEAYTFAEVQQITLEETQNLKTYLIKTLFV
jgi:asparagine synthetase A